MQHVLESRVKNSASLLLHKYQKTYLQWGKSKQIDDMLVIFLKKMQKTYHFRIPSDRESAILTPESHLSDKGKRSCNAAM
jgi:hypothetical protein